MGMGRRRLVLLLAKPCSADLGMRTVSVKYHRSRVTGVREKSRANLHLQGVGPAPSAMMRARELGLGEVGREGLGERAEMLRVQGLPSLQWP